MVKADSILYLANRLDLTGDQKRQSIRGDQIVAKTEGGYIRFAYEDEPELPPIAMFFKNLFGSA